MLVSQVVRVIETELSVSRADIYILDDTLIGEENETNVWVDGDGDGEGLMNYVGVECDTMYSIPDKPVDIQCEVLMANKKFGGANTAKHDVYPPPSQHKHQTKGMSQFGGEEDTEPLQKFTTK